MENIEEEIVDLDPLNIQIQTSNDVEKLLSI